MLREHRFWLILGACFTAWALSWLVAYLILHKRMAMQVIDEAERILDEQ